MIDEHDSGHEVFDLEGLLDEHQENLLSNFTLKQLMAFESVSKRWQTNVNRVIRGFKIIEVRIRG